MDGNGRVADAFDGELDRPLGGGLTCVAGVVGIRTPPGLVRMRCQARDDLT